MGHLDEIYAKYKDRGFMVLAVTNEGKALVDKFVSATGSTHPILIEEGDSATAYGIGGFPHAFLIDADGSVAWEGHPGSLQNTEIESLLANAHPLPRLPKKLAAAQKGLEGRDYAGARKALLGLLGGTGLDEAEKKSAEEAVRWIADRGESLLKGADVNSKAGNFHGAAETLRQATESFKGLDTAEKAKAALDELMRNPEAKKEIDAGDIWIKTKAAGKKAKPEQAAAAFRAFAKKWAGTKAADKATAAATAMEAQARR